MKTLLASAALVLILACSASNTEDNPSGIRENALLKGYEACLSAGGTEGYCQCFIDRLREDIPVAWFAGTEEPKPEWTDRAIATCTPIHPTPTPTPVPFSVEEWDPYDSPIPEGISREDYGAAYAKWRKEFDRLTVPWRESSDRVEMAWDNADVQALLIACRHWNSIQQQMWTPELIQLSAAVNFPSHPRRMDCRNMALNIFVPGAEFTDYVFDAP